MKRLWPLCAIVSALLLSAASPTPRNQQTGKATDEQNFIQPTPRTTANSPVAQLQPSSSPQGQGTADQTANSPDQSARTWLLLIGDRLWEVNWSNLALVVVGVWAARIAIRTLANIERQTIAAENQVSKLADELAENSTGYQGCNR
jgi:hypothetical protein